MDATERGLGQHGHADDERRVGHEVDGVTRGWVGDRVKILVVVGIDEIANVDQDDPHGDGEPRGARLARAPNVQDHGNHR